MKRVLLTMAVLLATFIGVSAQDSGTSKVELTYPDNIPTVTVTISDDSGLQNTSFFPDWASNMSFEAVFANNEWKYVIIKGTGISQEGLTKMCNSMTKVGDTTECSFNITESKFTGTVLSIPDKFSTMLFAPGAELPSEHILSLCSKLKYAYSGEKEGDKTIHLYASSAVTSAADIPELENIGEGWTVCLSGTNATVKEELEARGVTIEKVIPPYIGIIEISGEGDLESLIGAALPVGEDIASIKSLIIRDHVISQTEFDYLATMLPDVQALNLADATLPDDVRLGDNVGTVHWETIVLPKGTKISPNFAKYDKLKYAVGGALEKIWIVNRGDAGSLSTSGMADILPTGINDVADGMRLEVAFVGPTNKADVEFLVGNDKAPLSNARIWNFYNTTGFYESDFVGLGEKTLGDYNSPTGFILPPGMPIDNVYNSLSSQYKIGNIYSLSAGDNGRTLTVRINKTATFDIARFAKIGTRVAVLTDATVDNYIVKALKGTKRAVSVDLSNMNFPNNSDTILHNITTGSVIYVKLPDGINFNMDTYDGTTFGAIARIKKDTNHETAVCYQRVPGTLNKLVGYRSPEMRAQEHIRYRGLLNMHDIEHLLVNNSNIYCDMSDVCVVRYINGEEDENKKPNEFNIGMVEDNPDADMSKINNKFLKYLALPEGKAIPENLEAFKQNCPELLGVGTFNKATQELAFHSYAEEGGAAEGVIEMLRDDGDKITADNPVKAVTMSGNLNFHDITNGKNNCDADGHYSKENGQPGTGGAFDTTAGGMHIDLQECDFENAIFPKQEDMTFSGAGIYANISSIKLPTSPLMTLIPDECMTLFTDMTELCIPANYEILGSNAFRQMRGLKKITTTAVQEGNITDRGDNTIVLSYNLKEIRTEAFWGMDNMYDVYVLAEKAPKCAKGAFDAAMLYGNNGFNNVHPIQRINYRNGEKVIGMLHYPRAIIGTDEEKKYTDITRKYTLIDESGALNGEGELILWPLHEEFGRSYYQARYEVTIDGQKRGCNWGAWQEFDESGALISSETPDESFIQATMDNTYDLDYIGWHEFVLADNYYRKATNEEIAPNFSKFTEKDWYTVCFPYNMTRSQLLKYLGVPAGKEYVTENGNTETATENIYPDVRTLVEVKRHRNHSAAGGLITFVFSRNLVTALDGETADVKIDLNAIKNDNGQYYMAKGEKPWKYVEAERPTDEGYEDDPIVIKGGHPYLLKPYLPVETEINDVHFLPVQGETIGRGNTISIYGQEVDVPYTEHRIHAIDVDNSTDKEEVYATDGNRPYLYHFIGTYGYKEVDNTIGIKDKTLPFYSFFISKTKKKPQHMFYRTTTPGLSWNTFTSIIGGRSDVQIMNTTGIIGTKQAAPDKASANSSEVKENIYIDFKCDDDSFFDENGNAKQGVLSMGFTEESNNGTATGIIEYTPQQTAADAMAVYSMDGRYVGTSMNSLPKGIYIANGKKYIVK
ncbi:MAG: hypothetical protein NC344_08425 [Bacteroidales bacterium]|nr:hypothetical protein [Bacteroidales bacterium]MCM1147835.1 hypothetical protein [Bacteroidales bacterium]MCM1206483.1 hypothetical protein [Bacillota bacterium]MCM1510369.1 hypothetical protein [Clostridium sp.]